MGGRCFVVDNDIHVRFQTRSQNKFHPTLDCARLFDFLTIFNFGKNASCPVNRIGNFIDKCNPSFKRFPVVIFELVEMVKICIG